MGRDSIRTARAKGQGERTVIWSHALKNAILPVVTVIGIEFAFLIGGLVVTETVFNLPGVARFLVQAILWRDYPIVQNLVMRSESTRLNSSHGYISYAVFCLKKKKTKQENVEFHHHPLLRHASG